MKSSPNTNDVELAVESMWTGTIQQQTEKNMKLALVQAQQITIGVNQEYLNEWIAYRAEDKKKPMTPRAIKMATKWLIGYSEAEQERLICHAIMNNWEGLHYVPPPKAQTTRHTSLHDDLTDTSWSR